MEKSDLKPGMKVYNTITGNIGEVRGKEDGSLGYANWCVGIRRKIVTGKNKYRYDYPIWDVKNLELVP